MEENTNATRHIFDGVCSFFAYSDANYRDV